MTTIAPNLEEARRTGATRYWAGPCRHGHTAPRNTQNRSCSECARGRAAAKRAYDIERRPEYAARKRELRREWRKKEYEALLRRRADPNQWAVQILPRLRFRAKKAGIECTIGPEHLVVPAVCPVFGIKLVLGTPGYATGRPNAPSVDRFDNSRGYTPENVRVISLRANLLKKDATLDELRALVRYVEGGGASQQ